MYIDKYSADASRYQNMIYKNCGASGLKLPVIALGLWQNFGGDNIFENSRSMLFRAFDLGITHFDLANNYGPPPGSAEVTFGQVMSKDLKSYRDEMIISSKAGYTMWDGPYGDFGSRKYLIASVDQSLKRTGLEYFDIFYHHRPDPDTPMEETMGALDQIVRSGKALYAGVSNYNSAQLKQAIEILSSLGTPLLINQVKYNMFNRWIEDDLLKTLSDKGIGCIVFSPLAQGLLTDKYLDGIPENSRASRNFSLRTSQITDEVMLQIRNLNEIAQNRSQTLAQMSLAWVLRNKEVTSALIGASSVKQVEDAARTIENLNFSEDELEQIARIL